MSEEGESSAKNDAPEEQEASDQNSDENYSYSSDSMSSVASDDFTKNSDVTLVTSRSSLSQTSSFYLTKGSRKGSKVSNNEERSYTPFSTQTTVRRPSQPRRRNMSFTNMEMMRIERENQHLLRKIMAQQRPVKSAQLHPSAVRLSTSAVNRKKMQRRIDEDNITILRKIQSAKSSSLSGITVPGYRY